jgi:DNA-binding IclR family transcriptional regulator
VETVKSIVKAANILELFLDNENVIALQDIAKSTGLNKATVNRIVFTLVKCGLLKQQKKRGKYSLGVRFLDFSEFIRNEPKGGVGAVSYLVELSRLVNESVYLIIWHGTDVMYNRVSDNPQGLLEAIPHDWADKPLHSTCVGKIILASMSDDEFKKYLRSKSLKKNGIDIEQIKEYLSTVRREGIALEEHRPGVNSIAVSIKNDGEEIVGAILLTGPSAHLTHSMMMKSIPTLKNCALKISKELGYRALNYC